MRGHGSKSAIVAANIRGLRQARGWSAARLVKELEAIGHQTNRVTMSKLENGGRASVTVDEFCAFAEVFGIPIEHLLTRSSCDRCKGAPPPGFTCNGCGAMGAGP